MTNQPKSMTHQEGILAPINHQPVDELPADIWNVPEVQEKLQVHYDTKNNLEIYDHLKIDGIMGIGPKYIGPNLKKEDDYFVNEWGLGYSRQDYEAGEYYEKTVIPLSDADTIEDLKAYQWPDPDWYDFNTI